LIPQHVPEAAICNRRKDSLLLHWNKAETAIPESSAIILGR